MTLPKGLRIALVALAATVLVLVVAVLLYLRLPWIRTETVRYPSGDATLVATLALPRFRDGPYPAAVIVHGSGTYPRLGLWTYARQLVPHGMAVLMYDKRGVGDSSGANPQDLVASAEVLRNVGNPDVAPAQFNIAACGEMIGILADDARAGVRWLRTRADIDPARIGYAGISQAGWIMPLAASRGDDVAFIISVSGPAVSCGIENRYSELTGENPGFRDLQLSPAEIDRELEAYDGPDGYDPLPVLASLRVPVLWVLGEADRSVPTSWSVENLERLIAERGAPFDLRVYPGADHVLRLGGSNWNRVDYWPEARAWLADKGILDGSGQASQ